MASGYHRWTTDGRPQERLKEAGLPVSGKKDDLVQRLLEHAQSAQQPEVPDVASASGTQQAANGSQGPLPVDEPAPAAPAAGSPPPTPPAPIAPIETAGPAPPATAARRKQPPDGEPNVVKPSGEPNGRAIKRARLEEPQVPAPVAETSLDGPVSLAPAADLGDGSEDEEDDFQPEPEPGPSSQRASDLYLDTVNRDMLDFDFERLCSVTLSNINIYACLVCGKYFQGRGKTSPAYAHSIGEDHHVFINLQSQAVSDPPPPPSDQPD